MKKIIVDNLELTENMVNELTKWFDPKISESYPEMFLAYIDQTKDTLIRLMCEENQSFDAAIKESLSGMILIQDSLRNLLPEKQKTC